MNQRHVPFGLIFLLTAPILPSIVANSEHEPKRFIQRRGNAMNILNFLRSTEKAPDPKTVPKITLSDIWKNLEDDISYLVYEDGRFIVYIDHEIDIQWETTEDFEKILGQRDDKSKNQYYNVMTRAALVETLPAAGLDYKQEQRFKRLIGEAIVCCLEGQYDNALSALGYAREYLSDRAQELSRYWYLSSSIWFASPFAVVAAAFWLWRPCLIHFLDREPFWLVMAICFGALGALLSVMSRTGKLAFSSSSGLQLHRLEALSRIGVGAMSGAVLDLAVLSKLFLSPLSTGERAHVVMMLVAFAAGASERLAPSIIAEFEKKASPPPPGGVGSGPPPGGAGSGPPPGGGGGGAGAGGAGPSAGGGAAGAGPDTAGAGPGPGAGGAGAKEDEGQKGPREPSPAGSRQPSGAAPGREG